MARGPRSLRRGRTRSDAGARLIPIHPAHAGALAIVLWSRMALGSQGARDRAQAGGAETVAESTGLGRQRYRETIRFGSAPAVSNAAARTAKLLPAAFADHSGHIIQGRSFQPRGDQISDSSNRVRLGPASHRRLQLRCMCLRHRTFLPLLS
jgi:hypothetical protein